MDSDQPRSTFSFPYAVPLVVFPILAFTSTRGWGSWLSLGATAVYFILVAAFLREAVSRKRYESVRAKDPTLNRLTWVLNWLLFFVLWPLGLWLVLFLPVVSGNR
ncbi:MAG: hypothetical protein ACE5FJ_04200 [Gemmatimonadales bacterium]